MGTDVMEALAEIRETLKRLEKRITELELKTQKKKTAAGGPL